MRLLLIARKSRKPRKRAGVAVTDEGGIGLEAQDVKGRAWAEANGHHVVHTVTDVKSGTVAPIDRKALRPWLTDEDKLALYDGLLISMTDRISRGTDEDFSRIEAWAADHGKRIVVVDGPQYPARRGTEFEESDFWTWTAQKRQARKEWEILRDRLVGKSMELREAGQLVGSWPLGYERAGGLYQAELTLSEHAPLVAEAFRRVADGAGARTVAIWLRAQTGQAIRARTLQLMIANPTYRGAHPNGAGYVLDCPAIVDEALFQAANAALAAGSKARGGNGRPGSDPFSGTLRCGTCGYLAYRHGGRTEYGTGRGQAYLRCGRGRGSSTEEKCGAPHLPYAEVTAAADAFLAADQTPELVAWSVPGDDHAAEKADVKRQMKEAVDAGNFGELAVLQAEFERLAALPVTPAQSGGRITGRTNGQAYTAWRDAGDVARIREYLKGGAFSLLVERDADGVIVITREWHDDPATDADGNFYGDNTEERQGDE